MKTGGHIISIAVALTIALVVDGSGRAAERNTISTNEVGESQLTVGQKAEQEVEKFYSKAHPQVQEYILWTATTFGPNGMWLPEDHFAELTEKERGEKTEYLALLLNDSEYGRHLCKGLAEAGALKDNRLLPGLMKVAAFAEEGKDYDCRPKWMAVAALSRQESDEAMPLLISLIDHGNQNTRMWALAALARKTGQNFGGDKEAWADWWEKQGHPPVDEKFLKRSESFSKLSGKQE